MKTIIINRNKGFNNKRVYISKLWNKNNRDKNAINILKRIKNIRNKIIKRL